MAVARTRRSRTTASRPTRTSTRSRRPADDEEDDADDEEEVRPVARRRDTAKKASSARKPSPRRARAEEDEDEDDDDADDDGSAPTRRAVAAREKAKKAAAAKKSSSRRRAPDPEDDEEDEDEDEYYEDEDDEDVDDEDEDEDDEEARPRRGKSSRTTSSRSTRRRRGGEEDAPVRAGLATGWAGFENLRANTARFPGRAYPDEDPHLYKILDEAPFVQFRQHWVPTDRGSNRPYVCINANPDDDDCPLCEIGDEPSGVVCFNAVQMDTGANPKVIMLQLNVSQTLAIQDAVKKQRWIKSLDNPDVYWSIYTSGKSGKKGGGQKQNHFVPVKARDVADEWEGIEPLTEDEEEEFMGKRYTPEAVNYPTKKDLRRVAASLNEDDED